MPSGISLPSDPGALIRSRPYRVLLVIASLIGLIVSLASWGFLELVHEIQVEVYEKLPGQLGFDSVPTWWPLPWLALAGLLTAIAIERLPGRGGHVPAEGLKTGGAPTKPVELPGVLLAATATLGLGLVLGPEAPLIALGMGLGILSMRLVKKDAPDQALGLMAAAGSFAAVSTIFGSPVIGAVLIIEATGLGGAVLPLVLLPGLLAAGIGSLVFIGLGSWTGFSTSAWQLSPFSLPPYGGPGWGDFVWTIVVAIVAAVIAFGIMELARWSKRLVETRPFVLTVAAGVVVAVLAIVFGQVTDEPANAVLFSGQESFGTLFALRRHDLPVDADPALPLQGSRVERLARQLPRRADVPGDLPRRGRRPDRVAPARLCRDAGRGGARRRDVRVGPAAAAVVGDDRAAAHRQRRARRRAARDRGGRRRLPGQPDPVGLRRQPHRRPHPGGAGAGGADVGRITLTPTRPFGLGT